ncbi:hypothetical protein PSCICJ_47980 [Pseudomonas cichorii]|uniref:Uncharacterized protein n=1 Tax=Pseudomonas cichorii TaxID=36746 RepID=A0ABQ1DT18_PSECI|nr:hypothetical protein PSCICJ_47980 [Pseudomonas cichorii]GFM94181.1 hypothetical protein PSCICP_41530 [Pseudomonas cichorii]
MFYCASAGLNDSFTPANGVLALVGGVVAMYNGVVYLPIIQQDLFADRPELVLPGRHSWTSLRALQTARNQCAKLSSIPAQAASSR